jgi:hypothetical protein
VPQTWIKTRNYYTHWDETERASALNSTDMHRAGVRMKHLLRTLYLDLVGIPQGAILAALLNPLCDDARYLTQLNHTEHRRKNPDSTVGALMHIEVRETPTEP